MKIIRFLGGLGNQMFQYAFYKAIEKRFPDVKADLTGFKDYPLHNGLELERIFDIQLTKVTPLINDLYNTDNRNWILRKLRRLLNLKNAYKRDDHPFTFDPGVFQNSEFLYYWGYWQNQGYFIDIAEEIKAAFTFKLPLNEENQQILQQIKEANSIAVHIRRGDYLKDPLLGGCCGKDYYQQAIDVIQKTTANPQFFIFSDDISWCKESLSLTGATFISWNKGQDSYIDMQLMSQCKHNIIANSSFSWWAAWLNQHPNKIVIGPNKWVNDPLYAGNNIIPPDWIQL
ncbi:alpha-1,2-fucosyltransferase [Pedobacter sp. PLR]|uniref:alpha-1,2-fucosyltransferase n=1 Tax=Pedobacter sp. PLR TaxID=2994465 RepID=UPI00224567FC|nr:alpha-1,2-fucosyltransferase [Pedobacter sp. PLR]MCX2450385.1 alpha-1,2-fucosyltransferase [Pedobacter sp. PLR]